MKAGLMGIVVGVSTLLSLKNNKRLTDKSSLVPLIFEVVTIVSIAILSTF